ncbi:MAG: Nudix family hydrolase [Sedimenticola sp.]
MEHVHVAVAVIEDAEGRILLTRRHDHLHQGGLWEFPGGKVEPGEDVAQALVREAREELGIDVSAHFPLIRVKHSYSDKSVLLDVHRVTAFEGEPRGLEGQPMAWVAPDVLHRYPLPEADHPIVNALKLPSTCVITGEDPTRRSRFLSRLKSALERGQRLIQLRAPMLDNETYRSLAQASLALCREYDGARLLLNAEPSLVREIGADGVHLNGRRLGAIQQRPLPDGLWVSASCHTLSELKKAETLGLDFAFLSPVCKTASHPDVLPMGWQRFQALVDEVAMPVYALGGMGPKQIDQARRHGGQGIAAISAFWSD